MIVGATAPLTQQARPTPPELRAPAAQPAQGSEGAEKFFGPDLVITNITAFPFQPMPGQPVWFDVVVRNQGTLPAGPFNVRLDSAGMDQTVRVYEGIPQGGARRLHMGPMQTGFQNVYWIHGTVDSWNEVPETNEWNNQVNFSLVAGPGPYPPPPGPYPGPYPPYPPMPPIPPPRVMLAE